jgi:hypothetical protein
MRLSRDMKSLTTPAGMYFAICAAFWILTILSPLKWATHFLQIDVDHIYNQMFFLFLVLIGLLFRIPMRSTLGASILTGAVSGLISANLGVLAVELRRKYAIEILLRPHPQFWSWRDVLFAYIVFPTFPLLGPLWGAAVASTFYWMNRRRRPEIKPA